MSATGRGVAAWSSAAWRATAVAWLDERLAAAGLDRTGEVAQPHLRPWATVLRAPTTTGPVWLKATASGTAAEVPLYELLARAVPERVLIPLATDVERGWLLLPDGGRSLGERTAGRERAEALAGALGRYGELQRALEPRAGELLAIGVGDMRPEAMPERFREALDAVRAKRGDGAVVERVAAIEGTVAAWCERLAASPPASSLDHNDLHPWNVLGDGGDDVRYYDWGDSVVAHPFAAALVPLGFVARELGEAGVLRARDLYLDAFSGLAPRAELGETLEVACRVAKIARVLTWERALQTAREQGEPVDPSYASAPARTLAALLDGSYLGGA